MPARTGEEYLAGLREQPREVHIRGQRVEDVTSFPGLANGARSIAGLYDMQHDAALQDEMTYLSPTTGAPVGLSFIAPRTKEDLERRRVMMSHWARTSYGMMGRTPDFLNVSIMAMAEAGDYFGQNRPEFKQNIINYYEYIRENDLTLTHTLVNLQRNRRQMATTRDYDTDVALAVVRETDAGLVVRGPRVLATLGPLSDVATGGACAKAPPGLTVGKDEKGRSLFLVIGTIRLIATAGALQLHVPGNYFQDVHAALDVVDNGHLEAGPPEILLAARYEWYERFVCPHPPSAAAQT